MEALLVTWPEYSPATYVDPIAPALWPITYDTFDNPAFVGLEALQLDYWSNLRRGPAVTLPAQAFVERRGRAITQARHAKKAEEAAVGLMRENGVFGRLAPVLMAAEVSALVARWNNGPTSGPLYMASTALRSAYFLWLEDDSRAMGALRVVLEHTAKARTYRLKPDKASRLQSTPFANSTTRWIEACGWRRLGMFTRCLSELSHLTGKARWPEALEGLRLIRGPNIATDGEDKSIFTARSNALDLVSYLLLQEALSQFAVHSGAIADSLRTEFGVSVFETELDGLLDQMHAVEFPHAEHRQDLSQAELVGLLGVELFDELEALKRQGGATR